MFCGQCACMHAYSARAVVLEVTHSGGQCVRLCCHQIPPILPQAILLLLASLILEPHTYNPH